MNSEITEVFDLYLPTIYKAWAEEQQWKCPI